MNVCGIDASTYAVDFVFLHENGRAEWHRIDLYGQDYWERCRMVRFPSEWFLDTEAVGVEVAFGPSSGQINAIVGAVLNRLPTKLLVQKWPVNVWKKAVVGKGNATKAEVMEHVLVNAFDYGWKTDEGALEQDAADAWCIAQATAQAIDREKAA